MFYLFLWLCHPPVPSGSAECCWKTDGVSGDADSLLNPRSVGNRVICVHAKHGHPFEEVLVECGFPQRWVPGIPPSCGVPVLSGAWSCLAQGLRRAWEVPWEREDPGCSVPLSRVYPSVSCDSSDHGSPKAQGADLYCPLVWLCHSLSWAWVSHSPASQSSTNHPVASGSGWESMSRNVFSSPTSSYQGYK